MKYSLSHTALLAKIDMTELNLQSGVKKKKGADRKCKDPFRSRKPSQAIIHSLVSLIRTLTGADFWIW